MKKILLITALCSLFFNAIAQEESLLKGIEDSLPVTEKVSGAFKSTRVINAHSIEMLAKGNLDFRIMHRFGFVSDGVKQFFGLDQATMRMSFDYGLTNNLTIGIGRSTYRKELDGFVKSRLLQQTKGAKLIPVSVIVAIGYVVHTEESFAAVRPNIVDRSAYYYQLVVGRKFNAKFSLQLSPILVHTNLPVDINENQTIFALGGGARYGISKRMAITLDYHHPFGNLPQNYTDPLSVGIDISTGGHTFQLQFSNTIGMNERAYITETTGSFFKGDIRFGFNLSRIFNTGKKKK
jgi:opacity protein-like surface antigen